MTEIENAAQIEQLCELPLVVLFKHSPRCPISRSARAEVERFSEEVPTVPVFVIDVIRNAALSGTIADRSGVRHESPQTIIFRRGAVIWHASHYEVTKASLRDNLAA